MEKNPQVVIFMGSKNDFVKIKGATDVLKEFGVTFQARVMSAHRTPAAVVETVTNSEANGTQVFIAAAGVAAHLAGVVAAHTTKPVIGIPVDGGPLDGLDALLSTVQMPGGIPVATVAIGSMGAKNAGLLAVQMLALSNEGLAAALKQYRVDMGAKIAADDAALQEEL